MTPPVVLSPPVVVSQLGDKISARRPVSVSLSPPGGKSCLMPLEGFVKPGQVVESLVQRDLALLQGFSNFSNFYMRETHLWVLLKCRFWFSRWGLRFCISDKLPNNANAAAVRTTFEVARTYKARGTGSVEYNRKKGLSLVPDRPGCISTLTLHSVFQQPSLLDRVQGGATSSHPWEAKLLLPG